MSYRPEQLGSPPPGYQDYQRLSELVALLDTEVERVIPYDIAMSDRPIQDIILRPDTDGVLDEEFRWLVVEAGIRAVKRMYEIYNLGGVGGEGELPPTNRGFSLCGPSDIALRSHFNRLFLDETPEGLEPFRLEAAMRRYQPAQTGTHPESAWIDHTFLLLRTGNGWVHYIDPTAELQWGAVDYSKPDAAGNIIRHVVCREEELDDCLAGYQLVQLPDNDDPGWENIYLFRPGSTKEEAEILLELINGGYGYNLRTDDDFAHDLHFWGAYTGTEMWVRITDITETYLAICALVEHIGMAHGPTSELSLKYPYVADELRHYQACLDEWHAHTASGIAAPLPPSQAKRCQDILHIATKYFTVLPEGETA